MKEVKKITDDAGNVVSLCVPENAPKGSRMRVAVYSTAIRTYAKVERLTGRIVKLREFHENDVPLIEKDEWIQLKEFESEPKKGKVVTGENEAGKKILADPEPQAEPAPEITIADVMVEMSRLRTDLEKAGVLPAKTVDA